MSEKKLDNAEYKVKRTDGNVLSGDSNKIKLKITSYAIIMEVQEAYMQEEIKEEIKAQEEKQKELEQKLENDNLSFKEKREIKKELSFISEELNIRNEIYAEFSKSRKRFLELAKKALKLPEENLKQLGETGWLEIEGEKVNIDKEYEDIQNKLMDAQDNEIVFTNVDTDAIKEEVERAMGEKDKEVPSEYANNGDFISQHITADNFDESVHAAAEDIKEAVKLVAAEAKLVAEPSSCVGIAALLGGEVNVSPDENVCFILTSGNWDIDMIGKILNDEPVEGML